MEQSEQEIARIRENNTITDKRYRLEKVEQWREIISSGIPFMQFPEDALVRILPPFGGALARFTVSRPERPQSWVSVYLDWYDRLGIMERPYYEAYAIDGDTRRYGIDETDRMIADIAHELGLGEDSEQEPEQPIDDNYEF